MNNIIEISDESDENDDDGYKDDPKSPKLINNKDIFSDHFCEEQNEWTYESLFLKFFTKETNTNSQNPNSCQLPIPCVVNGQGCSKIKENGIETVPEQCCDLPTAPQQGQGAPLPLTQGFSVSPKDFASYLHVDENNITSLPSTQVLFVTQKDFASNLLENENDVIVISDDDSNDVGCNVFCSDERVTSESAADVGDEHFVISQVSSSDNSQFSMSGLPGWLSKASLSQTCSFNDEEEDDKSSKSSAKANDKNVGSSSKLLTGQASEVHTKPKRISRSDSFDIVPTQASQEFAHCKSTNKKDERQKLDGYTCRNCHNYWSSSYQSQEEMEENVKSKSRHRERYRAPPSPEGFWKLGFHSSDEEKQDEGEDETSVSPPSSVRHRRRRPLEKKFKSKSEEETDKMLNTQNDSGFGSGD